MTFGVGGPQSPFSISSSFILFFVLLPFFLETKKITRGKVWRTCQSVLMWLLSLSSVAPQAEDLLHSSQQHARRRRHTVPRLLVTRVSSGQEQKFISFLSDVEKTLCAVQDSEIDSLMHVDKEWWRKLVTFLCLKLYVSYPHTSDRVGRVFAFCRMLAMPRQRWLNTFFFFLICCRVFHCNIN